MWLHSRLQQVSVNSYTDILYLTLAAFVVLMLGRPESWLPIIWVAWHS
jgi:hypothetical protein